MPDFKITFNEPQVSRFKKWKMNEQLVGVRTFLRINVSFYFLPKNPQSEGGECTQFLRQGERLDAPGSQSGMFIARSYLGVLV